MTKAEYKERFDKIIPLLPRNYVSVIQFFIPEKWKNDQLRNFKKGRTRNEELLKDFEELLKIKR